MQVDKMTCIPVAEPGGLDVHATIDWLGWTSIFYVWPDLADELSRQYRWMAGAVDDIS
jgi:hypothetical protein